MDNTSQKPNRLMRGVLVGSLALNIAMIGAVGGFAYKMRHADAAPQRIMFDFGGIARVLDHDDRRAIGERLRRDGPRLAPRQNQRQKMQVLAEALRAEPFDVARVSEIMESLQQRSRNVQANAQAAFVAQLAAMTAEERAEIADRLERRKP